MEQAVFHIHAHLSFSLDGQAVAVPQGIGIAPDGSCLCWLHTHTSDGVIHVEAPQVRSFTLGDFLDIWKTQFASLGYPNKLDMSEGWQAYVDGKPFSGDFRTIPLQAHTLVTLASASSQIAPSTGMGSSVLESPVARDGSSRPMRNRNAEIHSIPLVLAFPCHFSYTLTMVTDSNNYCHKTQ